MKSGSAVYSAMNELLDYAEHQRDTFIYAQVHYFTWLLSDCKRKVFCDNNSNETNGMPIYVKRESILNTNKFYFNPHSQSYYYIFSYFVMCRVICLIRKESVIMTTCANKRHQEYWKYFECIFFSYICSWPRNWYGFTPKMNSINKKN